MEEEVKNEVTAQPTESPAEVKQDAKTVQESAPKKKEYVPLADLIRERQRRQSLEDRLDALEREASKGKAGDEKVLASELGVDEEAARKLHAVLQRYTGQSGSEKEELRMLEAKFQQRANEAAMTLEDWDAVKPDMERIFQEKASLDIKKALSESPEYYYEIAIGRKTLEEKRNQKLKQESKEKIESQSLASVESGQGSGRPPKKNIWTRERIRDLSPEEYQKNLPEIQRAMARGELS